MAPTRISQWLASTRLRQTMPNGEPWTQDYLLARMLETIGWAPARPNYSRYENGKSTPNRQTLAKFVDFWARLMEPGPEEESETAGTVTEPAVSDYLIRIDALVAQWAEERRELMSRIDQLLDRLSPLPPDPEGLAELEEAQVPFGSTSQPPQPAPAPNGPRRSGVLQAA